MSVVSTTIANLAQGHLGNSKKIANLDSEQSTEAAVMRLFYELSRQIVMGDHEWNFTVGEQTLALVATSPNDEYNYSYRYPVGCLDIIKIKNPGVRFDVEGTAVVYKIVKDAAGQLIWTNQENAVIEFIEDVDDPNFFSSPYVMALSYQLASYAAPALTRGDPFKVKQELLGYYQLELGRAKEKDMNEAVSEPLPESDSITVRN